MNSDDLIARHLGLEFPNKTLSNQVDISRIPTKASIRAEQTAILEPLKPTRPREFSIYSNPNIRLPDTNSISAAAPSYQIVPNNASTQWIPPIGTAVNNFEGLHFSQMRADYLNALALQIHRFHARFSNSAYRLSELSPAAARQQPPRTGGEQTPTPAAPEPSSISISVSASASADAPVQSQSSSACIAPEQTSASAATTPKSNQTFVWAPPPNDTTDMEPFFAVVEAQEQADRDPCHIRDFREMLPKTFLEPPKFMEFLARRAAAQQRERERRRKAEEGEEGAEEEEEVEPVEEPEYDSEAEDDGCEDYVEDYYNEEYDAVGDDDGAED